MHSEEEASVSIFDNSFKAKQRDRAAFLASDCDPLHETVSERLLDRLDDCKDRQFRSVAILSGASNFVIPKLLRREGLEKVVVIDSSNDQLERLEKMAASLSNKQAMTTSIEFLRMEGEVLPVEPESFDCEYEWEFGPDE